MSGPRISVEGLQLGATPRVHLLPTEVLARRKAKASRQQFIFVLIGMVVVVAIALGVTSFGLATATNEKQLELTRSGVLISQAAHYSAVTSVQKQIDDITRLQPLVTKDEILWSKFVQTVEATLPPNTTITAFSASLATTAPAGPSTDPLKGDHIATINITAMGSQSAVSQWLAQLGSLPSVVDSSPGGVVLSSEPGLYTANVELLISSDALAKRFASGK